MQRCLLPALTLGAVWLTLPLHSLAQELDAGVSSLDAGAYAPRPVGAEADAGALLADAGLIAPVAPPTELTPPLEAPIDVGAVGGERAVDVTVRSKTKDAQKLQRSAEAVSVIDLKQAQQRSSDMGEVLARTQGVTLRRSGGLGSAFRFFLNGLSDDQIRFFLNGIPFDLSGYRMGIANVPVNMIDSLELYRGVLPVRFGADALGGAVNLVTDDQLEPGADASYNVGSFGTHRATARGRYHHEPSGFVMNVGGFFDDADNDYKVTVEVAEDSGRSRPAKVKRPHDHYRAWGASLETGVVERKWARRLLVRGYVSNTDKELQHNISMSVPYGEVTQGSLTGGASLRYSVALTRSLDLDLDGVFARVRLEFVDKAMWVYDWYGRRGRERQTPGEIGDDPTDQVNWQNSGWTRAMLTWKLAPQHLLRASSTPQFDSRTGDERLQTDPNGLDPLTAEQKLLRVVTGLEYELNAISMRGGPSGKGEGRDFEFGLDPNAGRSKEDADPFIGFRLQNILFAKNYVYRVNAEQPLPGNVVRRRDNATNGVGVGDSLRYTFTKWLYAKASYEYAIRLPNAYEVFGDGALTDPNLGLKPERSHNVNLGPRVDFPRSPIGNVLVDINGFLRATDQQIVWVSTNERKASYQNLYRARSSGIESNVAWVSRGRYVNLNGGITWQELVNTSTKGAYAAYEGDRIPNRPYLLAAWGGGLRFARLLHDGDVLEPFYTGRYVHEFYRGWESQGLKSSKAVVPMQQVHGLGVTYTLNTDYAKTSGTFEVINIGDAKTFDNFGAQRPGRGYFFKLTGKI